MIVTHQRPHFDEIMAIWMLTVFGEEHFPGIKEAKITYEGAGGEDLRGYSTEQLEAKGIICLGVGGGKFDEHPGTKTNKKEGECASSLVAKFLGIENDLSLAPILKFASNSDLKASGSPFDMAQTVKSIHQRYPDHPEEAINWAMIGIDAKYHEQKGFVDALEQIDQEGIKEEIPGSYGMTLKMITIISDNENINKAARFKGAAIVIQQNSTGNVQIFTQQKKGITLQRVAKELRTQEQRAKGQVITIDSEDLQAEGKVAGAEEWFYRYEGQQLLNGSLSCPDTPPTKLSLEKIREITKAEVRW